MAYLNHFGPLSSTWGSDIFFLSINSCQRMLLYLKQRKWPPEHIFRPLKSACICEPIFLDSGETVIWSEKICVCGV